MEEDSFTDYKEKYLQSLTDQNSMQLNLDQVMQENHNLKRELSISQSTNKHLTDELDTVEARHASTVADIERRWSEKVEKLKQSNGELRIQNRDFDGRIEKLSSQIAVLLANEAEHQQQVPAASVSVGNVSLEDSHRMEELTKYKECIVELEAELQQSQEQIKVLTMELAEFKERCEFLESTVKSKRDELMEKSAQVDTLQEQNIELAMEINSLRTTEEHNQKGNSLFAEVDDQRQKFRQMLEDQNKKFSQVVS